MHAERAARKHGKHKARVRVRGETREVERNSKSNGIGERKRG
jgi:hypothetical protein